MIQMDSELEMMDSGMMAGDIGLSNLLEKMECLCTSIMIKMDMRSLKMSKREKKVKWTHMAIR